jgi:hypothetical protein
MVGIEHRTICLFSELKLYIQLLLHYSSSIRMNSYTVYGHERHEENKARFVCAHANWLDEEERDVHQSRSPELCEASSEGGSVLANLALLLS